MKLQAASFRSTGLLCPPLFGLNPTGLIVMVAVMQCPRLLRHVDNESCQLSLSQSLIFRFNRLHIWRSVNITSFYRLNHKQNKFVFKTLVSFDVAQCCFAVYRQPFLLVYEILGWFFGAFSLLVVRSCCLMMNCKREIKKLRFDF